MSALLRRFRGLAIALAVLAITAGVVFATDPSAAPTSQPSAGQPTAAPTATPTATPTASPDVDKDKDKDKEQKAAETPEAPETPDADESPAADTHGALVSAAAQMETPAGFANHGAFVRCVAHMTGTLATVDLLKVTPKTCADAEAARNPEKAQRQADKAAEKAQRQADKASTGMGKGAAKQAAKGANN